MSWWSPGPRTSPGHATCRALVLCALLLAACGEGQAASEPTVVVSVLPQKYVVERIAGDALRVEALLPPGANPASFSPSLQQRRAVQRALLYVKVGHPHFPFEQAWLGAFLADAPELPVVDASAGLGRREGDPHLWLDPGHMEQLAVGVAEALSRRLPEQRAALQSRLADFQAEIAALDRELRRSLAAAAGRKFLVFHPAWGYFAEAYGLEQVAIETDHKEPDPHRLARLIEQARQAGVEVVFVQPQFDPSSAALLAREIGARLETLDPLAYDWPENLRRSARAIAAGAYD